MPSIRFNRRPATRRSRLLMACLQSPGGERHGVDDLLVTRATTKCAGESFSYLTLGGHAAATFVEKRLGGEDHARDAIAALHGATFDESHLQRMEMLGIAQPLDGDDGAAVALMGEQDA